MWLSQAAVDVELTGLVKVQHHSSVPGSELRIRGTLELEQKVALPQGSAMVDFDTSLFHHNALNQLQVVCATRLAAWLQSGRSKHLCISSVYCPCTAKMVSAE